MELQDFPSIISGCHLESRPKAPEMQENPPSPASQGFIPGFLFTFTFSELLFTVSFSA